MARYRWPDFPRLGNLRDNSPATEGQLGTTHAGEGRGRKPEIRIICSLGDYGRLPPHLCADCLIFQRDIPIVVWDDLMVAEWSAPWRNPMINSPLPLRANRTSVAAEKVRDVTWQNVDPQTLPEDIAAHYYAYKKAFELAETARRLFEEEANEAFDVGATNKLAFGYRFGRLSVAIVPKSSPSAKGAVSLASIAKAR